MQGMRMSLNSMKVWLPIVIVFLAGSIATALVPQAVPILGSIAKTFAVDGARLGWVVSFPTVVCALGALAFGVVVDKVGDIQLLLLGVVLVILGDIGVSLAPHLEWLFAARLFQGFGYISITVAAPAFIQRITTGDTRRAGCRLFMALEFHGACSRRLAGWHGCVEAASCTLGRQHQSVGGNLASAYQPACLFGCGRRGRCRHVAGGCDGDAAHLAG
jgi:cyanate permease